MGSVKFNGQVEPTASLISYRIDIKRVLRRKFAIGIADGTLSVDGEPIYEVRDLRVGVFTADNETRVP